MNFNYFLREHYSFQLYSKISHAEMVTDHSRRSAAQIVVKIRIQGLTDRETYQTVMVFEHSYIAGQRTAWKVLPLLHYVKRFSDGKRRAFTHMGLDTFRYLHHTYERFENIAHVTFSVVDIEVKHLAVFKLLYRLQVKPGWEHIWYVTVAHFSVKIAIKFSHHEGKNGLFCILEPDCKKSHFHAIEVQLHWFTRICIK